MGVEIISVIDTETTGFDPKEGAQLLEVAWVVLQREGSWQVAGYGSNFVAFEGVIPPEAKAVHHITEEMVRPGNPGVLTRDQVRELFRPDEPPGVKAAHNLKFDDQFLPEIADWKGICTYRCALHSWPEAPSHSNQVLRYYLGAEPPPERLQGMAPHSALYDATVTAQILLKMLEKAEPEQLIELTKLPAVQQKVRFGKYRGTLWKDVPRDYLQWMARVSDFYRDDPDVRYTVDQCLRR